jgi:hypothetical protein|uniref:NADH-QUINONE OXIDOREDUCTASE SUBUNIT 1 n=1 Tax=Myoviridae sp. ct8mY9 TaxID=2827664 RepID=A0A8S5SFK0_9CAUD|nr:MAG TPA: NADH-QUINONE OXIDOREDUCTASE SUBUNIT 1 [Myoviridae sp. ct8mY9]
MSKEYRINMFFVGGTTFCTTVPEDEKDKIIECLNDRKIEQIRFGPSEEDKGIYIINLKNLNLIKISEELE